MYIVHIQTFLSVRQLTAVSSAARQLLALFERAVGGALADAVTLLFGG